MYKKCSARKRKMLVLTTPKLIKYLLTKIESNYEEYEITEA